MRFIFRICGTCALLIGAVLTSLFFQDKTFSAYVVRDQVQEQLLAGKKLAVIMTPYDLSPGGGEKYTLDFCSTLQRTSHHVVVISYTRNIVTSFSRLQSTISRLRVPISSNQIELRFAEDHQMKDALAWFKNRADVYFQLGNDKIPIFQNPAAVSSV